MASAHRPDTSAEHPRPAAADPAVNRQPGDLGPERARPRGRAFAAVGCGNATGATVWSYATGSAITGAPAVEQGQLYVGTQDGRLLAFAPS